MNTNFIPSLEGVYKDLEKIEGVKFTPRELDIIACILNGRTSKKEIASFLSIQPRTAETHIHNITRKVGCTSWGGIRDFIEKCGQSDTLRHLYKDLFIQEKFKKSLKAIAYVIGKAPYIFSIFFEEEEIKSSKIVSRILEDLKRLGIKIVIEACLIKNEGPLSIKASGGSPILFFVSSRASFSLKTSLQKKMPNSITYILPFPEDGPPQKLNQEGNNPEYIGFEEQESYYLFFFKILENTLSDKRLKEKISDLKKQYQSSSYFSKDTLYLPSIEVQKPSHLKKSLSFFLEESLQKIKKHLFLLIFIIISIGCVGIFIFKLVKDSSSQDQYNPQTSILIRSPLIIPAEGSLLNRPNLIDQIQKKLSNQHGIQTVSLVGVVGMGGVGKTTLARVFGLTQKSPIVYEINGETKNSLIGSFKALAKDFDQKGTKETQEEFEEIKNIKDPEEQEKRILSFVQKRLKDYKQWILIYDNIESLSDIKEYFPQDPKIWGEGRVIITTRNNNIKNSSYINPENIIKIDELTEEEALILFTKILLECDPDKLLYKKREEILSFLKNIPPFPLDILIAASYIKATRIPFDGYLENLKQDAADFESLQQSLLEDNSDYTKTRFFIITQSLNKLIETHPDFGDMLMMMSLLDSQDMPRELFDLYKSKIGVDNFIYYLKKYSLITLKNSDLMDSSTFFSMHRSTQEITRTYLRKKRDQTENGLSVQLISTILENYMKNMIDKENFEHVKLLTTHIKTFLSYEDLFTCPINIKGSLYGALGGGYYFLGDYSKAQQFLEEGLFILRTRPQENSNSIAQSLIHLGNVYRQQGNFKKAQTLFEESLEIYQKNPSTYYSQIAQILMYLGRIYADSGQSQKGISFFEKALDIYETKDHQNYSKIAWVLIYTGDIYREAGNYKKAKYFQEKGLKIYKEQCPKEQHNHALALTLLGNTNRSLGFYEESKDLLEKSTTLYKKIYGDRMPWASIHLGNTYQKLGMYKKSREILEKTVSIYKNNFQYDNHYTAWAFVHLGGLYRDLGHYEEAKEMMENGLDLYRKVFQEENLNLAWAFIHLGSVYASLGEYEQARVVTEKSLVIHRRHYTEDHPKIAWIFLNLGNIYIKLGRYEEAQKLLEKSLISYTSHYGQDHIETARVQRMMGILYFLQGETEKAEALLVKSLTSFRKNVHPDIYIVLENLGDLYIQKAIQSHNAYQSRKFRGQAINYFKQALTTVKTHLPKNSPKIKMIESKLEDILKK